MFPIQWSIAFINLVTIQLFSVEHSNLNKISSQQNQTLLRVCSSSFYRTSNDISILASHPKTFWRADFLLRSDQGLMLYLHQIKGLIFYLHQIEGLIFYCILFCQLWWHSWSPWQRHSDVPMLKDLKFLYIMLDPNVTYCPYLQLHHK